MNDVCESAAAIAAPHGGLRAVLDALAARHARGETPVLAIVTACSGPTYRKPGALALFDETGLVAGALSGGCLEEELAIAAREALATARAVAHAVDTGSADDLVFGTGSGCGGRMDVLLQPLPPQAPLAAALRALRSGTAPLAVTLHADGSGAAQLGEGAAWQWSAPAGSAALAGTPAAHFAINPPPRLLALGAGPETPALLQFLQRLGWYVEVQEHRARWAGYAAGADALHAAHPGTLPGVAARCRAAVVMTHQFEGDRAHLAALAATAIPYIGLLGPTARRDALLAALGEAVAANLRPRLHAPVGLRLGGEGPEAIALSIAAGLVAHLHGRGDG